MIIKETEWLWTRLAREKRPIVLYGMGNGAEKILDLCTQYHIPVQDLFASDEFVRGQHFRGFQVKRYAEICTLYENPLILVAFGTEKPEVLERIAQIAQKYEVLAPDVPLFGTDIANEEQLKARGYELEQVYHGLADELSRQVFADLLNYKISGKINYLTAHETPREEALQLLFPLEEAPVYVDLGAYDGDTVEEFILHTQGNYERIVALEPDRKNYAKLQRKIEEKQYTQVELYPYASWQEPAELSFEGRGGRNSALGEKGYTVTAETVDRILAGKKASLIKMDVEGAEYETLLGCRETIRQFAPKFAVSAYHHTWDFVTLPLLIWRLHPEYQIFLRHHPYIPAWETNLYVIPPQK